MTHASDDHLRRLPKVELHCHVEGSARASTIADLARSHDVTLPVEDPVELFQFTSLNQFLSIYDVICASLRTADDFRRITYEALEDGAAAGVRYREMFFSPGFPRMVPWPSSERTCGAARTSSCAFPTVRCRARSSAGDTVQPAPGLWQ